MTKGASIIGSAVFLPIAPGMVAGVIPCWIAGESSQSSLPLKIFGLLLIAAGASVLLDSFARFALEGLGTPAPILPPRHLVVSGLYRFTRNPMYVSVLTIVLGQSLFHGNGAVLAYGAIVWLLFHTFVMLYEEPTLAATFGEEYAAYRAKVPRWLPRFRR